MRRALVVAVTLLALAGCKSSTTASPTTDTPGTASATTSAPTKTTAPAKPKMTKSQSEALGSAQDYLSISGFSFKGLVGQLVTGDGYSKADATFAAENCHANWNAEAAKSAKDYLGISHFSRSGLIDQLVQGDGYTKAQAAYGATKVGL